MFGVINNLILNDLNNFNIIYFVEFVDLKVLS